MPDDLMHVVTLSAEEQLTVKLLAQNFVKIVTKLHMTDLLKSDNDKDLRDRWDRFCRTFDAYEELCHNMPTPYDMERAKTKLFNFSSRGMRQILKMFDTYNPAHTGNMETEAMQIIEANIDVLKTKMSESARYQYSANEVKAAFGK